MRAALRVGEYARHAAVLLLFAALAIAWTWPLARHLDAAIPGEPGDNYSFVWNVWWMRHVLATPGLPYFHTTYLFHPFGASIANHPHTALPALIGATLLRSTSPATAQNLLLIAYVFANLAAMYALAWTVTRQVAASALAAATFGLSPYVGVHMLGHFDLVAAWTIPLFALALDRALRGSNGAAVAAGLVLAATAYTAYYHLVYECFFAAIYIAVKGGAVQIARSVPAPRRVAATLLVPAAVAALIAAWIAITGGTTIAVRGGRVSATEPQNALTAMWLCLALYAIVRWRPRLVLATTNWRRIAGVSWRVAAAFLIAALPLVWAAARLVASGDYVSQQYAWRNAPTGVDLLSPLIGSPVHPLVSGVSGRAYAAFGDNFIEAVGWLGVVPLLLAAGVRAAAARAWRVTAAVFFVWALGPFLRIGGFDTGLKLPAILLRFVPFVANARMPGRAMIMVYAAVAVLAAYRLAESERLRSPLLQWLLVALVVFEFWRAPLPLTALDRPAVYAALARAAPGAVCEVPLGIGDGLSKGIGSQDRRVLFYATQHEHPLVGGFIGRMPADAAERIERLPVAGALLALSDGAAASAAQKVAATPSPCRYLVVRRSASTEALLNYVASLKAERIIADGDRELFRLW
ncbi:MAG TPA: hypothetical protein VKD69_13415 [Vicinamibacterales bacterium]|nr:hypothetical protein [Vicinamibacterales bacterium]